MICSRCKNTMNELKRTFHKQRKWVCPRCGFIRFQKLKKGSYAPGRESHTFSCNRTNSRAYSE